MQIKFNMGSPRERLDNEEASLTAAYVEGVVFVQGPAAQVRWHQLKAVHRSRPPLPLDGARARLVLVTHRNWRREVGRRRRKESKNNIPTHECAACAVITVIRLLPKLLNPSCRIELDSAPRAPASRRKAPGGEASSERDRPEVGNAAIRAASLHEQSLELAAWPLGGNDTVCSSSTPANNHQHLHSWLSMNPCIFIKKKTTKQKTKQNNSLAV